MDAARYLRALILLASVLLAIVILAGSVLPASAQTQTISFNRKAIFSKTSPGGSLFNNPTTLALGPDGRLYVGQQNGRIHVLTLDADLDVTNVQVFHTIYNTPNRNDDGSPSTAVGRTLLGLVFDPDSTATQPILYVSHSDPRIGHNNSTNALQIDTYSGRITRLVGPSFDNPSNRTDLVTDLPRSRENHASNGLAWGPDGWLYMPQGANTNNGAPSVFFSELPERYLTAAVLRINVKSPGFSPINVRDVISKATEMPGIFEVYATGWRNAYDLVWHSNGKLYVTDNDGSSGYGETPGPEDGCPDGVRVGPPSQLDSLNLVPQGSYGGHPNPARGECIYEDGTLYNPDLPPEPNYIAPLVKFNKGASTNGLLEYLADTFDGAMRGNLVAATWAGDQNLRRITLSPDGNSVVSVNNLGAFSQPLDVIANANGVIFVAEHGGDAITALIPGTPAENGFWAAQPSLPSPRAEVGVGELNGKIYVVGGLCQGCGGRENSLLIYDPVARTWSQGADYPGLPLDHVGVASVGGKLYLIGGLRGWPGPSVDTLYAYDPTTNTWEQKASLPTPRGAMGVAVLDGKIYAVGGLSGDLAVPDLTVYDPVANTWTSKTPMPTKRDHLIAAAVNGKIYAIAGRNVGTSSIVNNNEVYDPVTNTWSTAAPIPTKRGGHGAGVLNGKIIVFGGEGNSAFSGTIPLTEQYDPQTNTWRELAQMLYPMHGIGGAVYNDTIFVPGGAPTPGASSSANHQAFAFGGTVGSCPAGGDPNVVDSDSDGYKDQDETDNGTDVCSPASFPLDFDRDFVSDLNDPDDDGDGILDTQDQLYFDRFNGTDTSLPLHYGWNPGDAPLGGVDNSGFTGTQIASSGPRTVPENIGVGGAGGFLSIATTSGTAVGSANSQENALQLGFDAREAFRVTTRVTGAFEGKTPSGNQAGGLFLGLDQDNYVRLVVTANTGSGAPGVQFALETNGSFNANPTGGNAPLTLPGPQNIDLILEGDPATQTLTAFYRVDSTSASDLVKVGSLDATSHPALATWFKNGLPVGLVATNAGTVNSLVFIFDFLSLEHTAFDPIRINAGGQQYTDTNNDVWVADTGYSGGIIQQETTPIAGTSDDLLYQQHRRGQGFSYAIPVPLGTYTVTLKFMEPYWTTAGKRVFDVQAEGQPALTNVDILAETAQFTALDKQFTVQVDDGQLDLQFIAVVDRPLVSAIEVVPGAGSPGQDTTAPTIISHSPAAGATSVAVGANVTAVFSEAIDQTTLTSSTFFLAKQTSGTVTTVLSYDSASRTATLNPTADLESSTTYVATIKGGTGGVRDLANNPLAADVSWSFTTAASSPGPGSAIRVNAAGGDYTDGAGQLWAADFGFNGGGMRSTATAIDGTADDPLYQTYRRGESFAYAFNVSNGSYTVTLKFMEPYWSYADRRIADIAAEGTTVLNDFDIMAETAKYTALDKQFVVDVQDGQLNLVVTAVKDQAILSAIEIVGGTAPSDTTAPTVTSTTPADGATGVLVGANVQAVFSEAIDSTTLSTSTFTLAKQSGGSALAATVSYDAGTKTATLNPGADLEAGTIYLATVKGGTGGVKDLAGNPLTSDKTWTFTTAASAPSDTTAPTVTSTSPASNATGVAVSSNVQAVFSEAIDPATLTSSTFTLARQSDGAAVAAALSYDAGARTATLNPSADLEAGTIYLATVKGGTGGVKDLAGNPLTSDKTWTFATTSGSSSPTTLRVNTGGGEYVDQNNQRWQADFGSNGGRKRSSSTTVANTADDELYQDYRSGATFDYAFDLANGTYTVTLKFSESYWSGAGKRVFDVKAEGTTVLDDFDILANAAQYTALDQSFTIEVDDGQLNLAFVASKDQAIVNAIEVRPATSGAELTVLAGEPAAPAGRHETSPVLARPVRVGP